jgi:hypothetical protein
MKKIFLTLGLCGILDFAQATPYTFTTTGLTTMSGESYYTWGITTQSSVLSQLQTALNGGQTLLDATLTFNNLKFTTAGPYLNGGGQIWSVLLGSTFNSKNINSGITTYTDNDLPSNAFGTSGQLINKDTFSKTFSTAITLSDAFTSADLTLLAQDILAGFINLGIDPDCVFTDSSISLVIDTQPAITNKTSVPDGASTAVLLGAALSGIALLRRKLR